MDAASRTISTVNLENAGVEAAIADGILKGVKTNASVERAKKAGVRRGKWTSEEEAYSNQLIHEFKAGLLPLTDGTTLRTFLSKLLNCDPMRISKKFVGGNCIGKQVFRRRQLDIDKLTLEQIDESRRNLADLERKFLERVAQTNRVKVPGANLPDNETYSSSTMPQSSTADTRERHGQPPKTRAKSEGTRAAPPSSSEPYSHPPPDASAGGALFPWTATSASSAVPPARTVSSAPSSDSLGMRAESLDRLFASDQSLARGVDPDPAPPFRGGDSARATARKQVAQPSANYPPHPGRPSVHRQAADTKHLKSEMPRNTSIDNFWMLVDMGDLPEPDTGVLSENLFAPAEHAELLAIKSEDKGAADSALTMTGGSDMYDAHGGARTAGQLAGPDVARQPRPSPSAAVEECARASTESARLPKSSSATVLSGMQGGGSLLLNMNGKRQQQSVSPSLSGSTSSSAISLPASVASKQLNGAIAQDAYTCHPLSRDDDAAMESIDSHIVVSGDPISASKRKYEGAHKYEA